MESIDRRIRELEENSLHSRITIDPRARDFWEVDDYWAAPGDQTNGYEYSPMRNDVDFLYGRYTLGINGQGLCTEDYWVLDNENPFFEMTLKEFLDEESKGNLPIEMTKRQRFFFRLNTLGVTISAVLMLTFAILLIYHFILHPIMFNTIPSGSTDLSSGGIIP